MPSPSSYGNNYLINLIAEAADVSPYTLLNLARHLNHELALGLDFIRVGRRLARPQRRRMPLRPIQCPKHNVLASMWPRKGKFRYAVHRQDGRKFICSLNPPRPKYWDDRLLKYGRVQCPKHDRPSSIQIVKGRFKYAVHCLEGRRVFCSLKDQSMCNPNRVTCTPLMPRVRLTEARPQHRLD